MIFAVFLPLNLCLCPAKLGRNTDFAPQNYGVMQTLPHKIMEPLFFARKIKESSFFAPQNYGVIQILLNKITET